MVFFYKMKKKIVISRLYFIIYSVCMLELYMIKYLYDKEGIKFNLWCIILYYKNIM